MYLTQVNTGSASQEIAALKRSRAHLQKQVIELQQRLSAVQEKAQAAAATAAAERAQYGRELAKCQQQLASAVQRLQGMAGREHQQKITMQEVWDVWRFESSHQDVPAVVLRAPSKVGYC